MQNRTDLAVECYENVEKSKFKDISVKSGNGITVVSVLDKRGEKEIGKPVGKYITVEVPSFANDTDIFDGRLDKISKILKNLLPPDCDNILVAGIGNIEITADALGPKTNSYVLATRHISAELRKNMGFGNLKSVSSVSTGVLGETGIESAEIVKGIVNVIKPSCVIVVDALAASSAKRLGTTVQLSNTGISPGSGVGNHRFEISKSTLGVPVVSVEIPTVVSTQLISEAEENPMFVTPREIDKLTEQGAKLIGMSINTCLQSEISARDLYALVG
ncbi:MAG: GPR endopeptidase [Clostridiales bacterium]|nr:GPR endopeptidase [Clostridiales bacterium]